MKLLHKITDSVVFKFILIFQKKFIYFDTFGIAAQMAYYFIFSIFPILLLIISLLPIFDIDPYIITTQVSIYLPNVLAETVNTIITDLLSISNGYIIFVSVLLTIWSGSSMANALIKSINRVNDGKITRNYFIGRGLSILFTIGFLMIIILTIISVPLGNNFIATYFPPHIELIFDLLSKLIIPAILSILIFGIYYFGPAGKSKIIHVIPGTIFTVVGFFILNVGFNYYIIHFSTYDVRYGTLGTVIAFMLWSYSIGMLIMIGALINSTIKDILYYLDNKEANTVMLNYADNEDFWNQEIEEAILNNQYISNLYHHHEENKNKNNKNHQD